jgi:hypothetical protein
VWLTLNDFCSTATRVKHDYGSYVIPDVSWRYVHAKIRQWDVTDASLCNCLPCYSQESSVEVELRRNRTKRIFNLTCDLWKMQRAMEMMDCYLLQLVDHPIAVV